MELGLAGKSAAVAGGTKGLGLAVARELLKEGAKVAIGSRSQDAQDAACKALGEDFTAKQSLKALTLDTSAEQSIGAWISEIVDSFGSLSFLVVNTGGPPAGSFESLNDNTWSEAYEQLLLGSVRLVRGALPYLKRAKGGSILFVTSTSVRQPIDNLLLSNVFRPAAAALAKSLSIELAPAGIRVNTLMPGRIDTDRVRTLDQTNALRRGVSLEEQKQNSLGGIPMGRYGEPAEFGRIAAFLLSPAASYITGSTLAVDGGMLRTL